MVESQDKPQKPTVNEIELGDLQHLDQIEQALSGENTPNVLSPGLRAEQQKQLNEDEQNEMEAMRRRMEKQNEIGGILLEELPTNFFQRLTAPLKQFQKKYLMIKGHTFKEHFEKTNKETEYDIRSLWILHGNWWIRRKLVWLVEWKPFENFITLVILANSVMLACTDYNDRLLGQSYISIQNLNMGQVDTAFTIIFLVECICKVLAMGFVLHRNSYMRDTWNWLDIFVVTISVITWLPNIDSNSSLKSLRTFRILRPLRSINSLPSMKALIQSLLSSLPGLFNVGIFLAFIFTIFAIFGTHQFNGNQYQRCRMTAAPTLIDGSTTDYEWPFYQDAPWLCATDADCAKMLGDGFTHRCSDLLSAGLDPQLDQPGAQSIIFFDIVNFNNVPSSLFTIFQCLTLEGWTLLMYNYMDSNNDYISVVYFCFMVIFGSFFAMQLVLANIMDSFAKDQEKKAQMLIDSEIQLEQKNEMANLFINAAKSKPTKPSHDQEENVSLRQILQEREPPIALNAEITKRLTLRKDVKKAPNQVNEQLELSDADLSEIIDLNDWATNKKDKFPSNQPQPDEDSEYEDETIYDINARERSKRNWLYRKLYKLVNHPFYNFIVFLLIISNTLTLACDDYPQSLAKEAVISQLNDFFTWAFTAEMILKLFGLGINNYIHDKFNLFDAFVVTLSLIDWTLTQILTKAEKTALGSGMQALRALRLLRVIKLARSWTALQDILGKIIKSLKDISNFGVLLFLFLYIYALLGMDMFSNKIRYDYFGVLIPDIPAAVANNQIIITPHYNYDNIYNALVTVFCVIMGEDWNNNMYSFVTPGILNQYLVMFFYLSLMIIGNIMLLNLFTAILLQNFDPTEEEKQAMLAKPKSQLSAKSLITKAFWHNIKIKVIRIFETKNKKKKLTASQQQAALVDAEPEKHMISNKNDKQSAQYQTALNQIALLHYELNEKAIGILIKSKTIMPDLEEMPILHGYSLFLFGPNNSYRQTCSFISKHKYQGNFILLLIAISTICLALQEPLEDPDSSKSYALGIIDNVMTGFFICEMLTHIIARGFAFCGKNSYIRESSNILDFIIVVSAFLGVVLNGISLGFIKSLRVLRVLRPLRVIAKHKGLKLAISALINSLPSIGNLLLIVWFFLFLLAILDCTLFAGAFWSCQTNQLNLADFIQQSGINTKYDCLMYGGEWVQNDFNYDNTFRSMLTLFSLQSTEGWSDSMWVMINSVGAELQPIYDGKRYYCALAIAQQFLMTLLCLNLFVGVVIESFNIEKEELSLNKLLKKVEQTWIETLQLCYGAKPSISTPKTNQKFRDLFIDVCNSKIFDNFILACILGNTLALCIVWYGQSQTQQNQLENVNYVFSAIFTVEAILKITAYRKNYFREAWNRFDFTVVVLTWLVVIIMSFKLPFDVSILGMIARTLRIGRVFRLVRRVPAIQIILQTLIDAIPAISALGLLLGLLFFLYAIIGISQFAFVNVQNNGQLEQRHVNFQSFPIAVLVLMRSTTGEAWDSIMFDYFRQQSIIFQCDPDQDYYGWKNNGQVTNGCGTWVSPIFFVSFVVIVCQIFLNLFIAIIIDSFLGQSQAFAMPVNQQDIDDFIEVWQQFDPNGLGTIECYNIEKFICKLSLTKSKLVANKKRILKNITFRRKFIAMLEIPSHHDFGAFTFIDVLQCMSRLVVEASYIRDQVLEYKKEILNQQKSKKQEGQQGNNEPGKQIVSNAIREVIQDKKDHKSEFRSYILGISQLNKNIASVDLILKTAGNLTKKQLGKIDINQLEADCTEIYSSKHYIYGELIVKCWRDFLEVKANEIAEANLEKQEKLNNSKGDNSQQELLHKDEVLSLE